MGTALVKMINENSLMTFFLAPRIRYAHLGRGKKAELNNIPDTSLKTEIAKNKTEI